MNAEILNVAFRLYGLSEEPGEKDNATILQMARECGFNDYIHDSTAWCSLMLNWLAWKAHYQRSYNLMARSWLNVGEETHDPQPGDVVVLHRGDPNGIYGHTGLYINMNKTYVYILGGNQNDSFNISSFAIDKIIGFRRLSVVV